MTTTAVVEHFNVFKQIGLRVLMRPVARGVNPFVLQAVEEAFRRGVVPAISLAAHRAAHTVGGQFALELVTRILGVFNRSSQHEIVEQILDARSMLLPESSIQASFEA